MKLSARIGQGILVLISAMSLVIATSVFFVEDPFPHDAQVLIASFGVGMGLLLIALAVFGLNRNQSWAWAALWTLPLFFAWHVLALGTIVPDGVLMVVSGIALLLTRPATAPDAAASERRTTSAVSSASR